MGFWPQVTIMVTGELADMPTSGYTKSRLHRIYDHILCSRRPWVVRTCLGCGDWVHCAETAHNTDRTITQTIFQNFFGGFSIVCGRHGRGMCTTAQPTTTAKIKFI